MNAYVYAWCSQKMLARIEVQKKFFTKKVRKSKKEGQFVLPTFNFGRMNWPPSFF